LPQLRAMKSIKKWGLSLCILAASNLALQQPYAGTVYKWVDDNGVVHYTDTPGDPELFEAREVESFEVKERKRHGLGRTKPVEQKAAEQTNDLASKTQARDPDQPKRIAELSPDQIGELIDKTWAYIQAEYAGTDLGKKQRELRRLVTKLRLNFDIKKPYKTRLREQFKEVGILFLRSKTEADRFEYVFGQIIKESKIDRHIPVTIFSTEGFVGRPRETHDAVLTLGFCRSGEVFINESSTRTQAIAIYDYSKRIRRLRGPFRLICRDFLNYKKTTDNLTKTELIQAYLYELIGVIIAHEKAHIHDSHTKDPIKREVIACLAALRDVPTLSALYYALSYAHQQVQKDIRQLFTKYGYDPNSLYVNPVEDISKVAGTILKKEYHFYK